MELGKMETREFRFLPKALAEIRVAEDAGVIEGYAAVFYDGSKGTEFEFWDGIKERVQPGAFDKALKRGRDDVLALFNHSPNQVLGRSGSGTLELSVDKVGLRYKIQSGDTTIARDVREHIKRGDITGSSFGFIAEEERVTTDAKGKTEIRELLSVKLLDVSPVTIPAYDATTVEARGLGAPVLSSKAPDEKFEPPVPVNTSPLF